MLDNIIEIHGKKVLLLEYAIVNNILPDPNIADVWVVNHNDAKLVRKFLCKIIRSEDIRVYLKPVFLQKEFKKGYSQSIELLKNLSDGYIKWLNFIDKIPYIEAINNFIRKKSHINDFTSKKSDDYFSFKIFNYYYTRKKNIFPIINRDSLTGYSYPRIEAFFNDKKEGFTRSRLLLREAFLGGSLSRHYVDTSHLCRNCHSGFLNFREICPKCSEHDLKVRNLIHHFRCAYVGVDKDFIFKDKMVCPKCTGELKNLGVDYDRPGKIFFCKNKKCNHEFQDAPIGVHCIDCNTEQSPDELIVRKIYSYELTNFGYQQVLEQ